MVYTEIANQLISLFQADSTLQNVKWLFGMPKLITEYPLGYVQFVSREPRGPHETGLFSYVLTYEIGVFVRNVDEDQAERDLYTYVEAVEDVLKNNPDLGGLVDDFPLPSTFDVMPLSEEDYAISFGRLRVSFLRKYSVAGTAEEVYITGETS